MEKDPRYTRRHPEYEDNESGGLGDKEQDKNSADILAEEPSFEEREKRAEYGENMALKLSLVKRGKKSEILHREFGSDGEPGPGVFLEFVGEHFNNLRLQQLEKMSDGEKNRCYENMAALRVLGEEMYIGVDRSNDPVWLYRDIHNKYLGDIDAALLERIYSSDEIDLETIKKYKDAKKKIEYVKDCYREYKEEKETGKDDSDSVEK